jgi:glycosyltransferase involved in cell wall biosynthesis
VNVLFLTKYPNEGASSRYRVYQYLAHVERAGIGFVAESFMTRELFELSHRRGHSLRKAWLTAAAILRRLSLLWRCRGFDLIYMQRECLPFGPPLLERWFRRIGKRTIFDYDDALFIFKSNARNPLANFIKRPQRVPEIMANVDCVVAGNDWLRDRAAEFCRDARTFHVAEDLERYTPKPTDAMAGGSITIGWLGSPSTEKYLNLIRPVLRSLCKRYPVLRLKVVGGGRFEDPEIPVVQTAWAIDTEVADLHSFDIGIMPLPLEEWSLGKSGGKARTYMAVGLPAVCTAMGFNRELISDGETGFLVTTLDEWEAALSRLVESPELRQRTGTAARREVERRYSLDVLGPQFVDILRSVAAKAATHE